MEYKNIELRSENTRQFLGKIPPRIVRLSTVVISLILLGFLLICSIVHFPISIETQGIAVHPDTLRIYIPYRYLHLFDEPRSAQVCMEGGVNPIYKLPLYSIDSELCKNKDGNYFTALILIGKAKPKMQKGQKAEAEIIIEDHTILQYFLPQK